MSEYIITDEQIAENQRLHGKKLLVMPVIVRCRDCINYSGEDNEIYPKWCMQMNITEVEPDGFCAWAERKEVDA